MNTFRIFLTSLLAVVCMRASADDLPSPMTPPRLINDFAGLIDDRTEAALEDSLRRFEKHTSNEVCIVTVDDLQGYDIADYAQRLGQKWGVGKASKKNGVLMLVKSKTAFSKGQAYIATGYGLEGALPDLTCRSIVNGEMIPCFRENKYSKGIAMGAEAVMQACKGEYTADPSLTEDENPWIPLIVFLAIIILSVYISRKQRRSGLSSDSGLLWLLLNSMSTHSSSRSDWGSFTSGSGSFGGGFGGFGGGSFGGGGGGGSW